ncbi:RNA polymerase sigma factor [Luteitalea sp. TBR-22]|uniref:RNA polymerase sigma factor n=1 Tax=Luteitalea sp. TBR-22 TaxID=2802971 RepID=UPI001AF25F76|nr:sigma-70 family RNA polymerase sigma factor [Luteitalea sp. TBR-22]BCS32618.1 RNA polymerase sigma factor [Luteitalea sp. TBR-22]
MGDTDLFDQQLRLLMRDVQAGDKAAYVAVLSAVTPRLRRFIRAQRRFLDEADVEDLVQDVLLSLHGSLATYDVSRPFMPWVLVIARYRLADAARRHSGHAREVRAGDVGVTLDDVSANPVDDGVGDLEALQAAIGHLPAGQRQAIELLKLQELSLKEAAAATGASVGALKVATHRAMHSLRRLLGAAQADDEHR